MSIEVGRTSVALRRCLVRLAARDVAVRSELLGYARRRLTLLADQMFAQFPILHGREQAEDLLQEAMIRLWQSVEQVGPTTVAGFMGLAALQMRRALQDLARNHFGRRLEADQSANRRPVVNGNNGHTFEYQPADSTWHPETLACWSEFHAAAGLLPEPERTAFDLLYYHELSQIEAAEVMEVSERQVRRYWRSARQELQRVLEGILPK